MFSFIKKKLTASKDTLALTRRWFLKGAVIGGGSIAAVASLVGLTKTVYAKNNQEAYDRDVIPGDKILQDNGFEEVSKQETDAMIQMFVNDYPKKKLS